MPPRLLCVDDRLSGLELRRSILEAHGYSVLTANTVHAALQILHREPIAAVLVEYKGEGMDAEAVALRVRQQFPTCLWCCCPRILSCRAGSCGWLMST